MSTDQEKKDSNTDTAIDLPAVSVEIKRKIAFIQINTKLNIVTLEMAQQIVEILQEANNNPRVNCIVFKTAGTGVFSAGWDLKMFKEGISMQSVEDMLTIGGQVARHIMTINKPIIAQIQGSAIGFGCILAFACDFRIVADREDLYFTLPDVMIIHTLLCARLEFTR